MPAQDSNEFFDIIFTGECAPDHDPQAMRQGVQALFRLDEAQARKLFRAGRVVVKHAIDLPTACRFQMAFTEVGALVELVPSEVEETIVATAAAEPQSPPPPTRLRPAPQPPPVPAGTDAGWPEPVPADDVEAALLAHTVTPGGGVNMDDGAQTTSDEPPTLSVQDLALAPVGTPLQELDDRVPVAFPDTSQLALVRDANWSLADCAPPPARTRMPPIDHLQLEPIVAPPHRGANDLG